MPTPTPCVEITLGGLPRPLRYDFNAFVYVEQKTGKSISQLSDWSKMKISHVRAIVFAGLYSQNKKLTEFEVGSWMWLGNIGYVVTKVGEALASSLNKGKKEAAEKPAPLSPAMMPSQ